MEFRRDHGGQSKDGLQQLLCCCVRGIGNKIRRGSCLNNPPLAEYRHARTEPCHCGQVVGDKDQSKALLLRKILQHCKDLVPEGEIQSADWFVGQKELGRWCQRPGNCHTLVLSPGKFTGTPVQQIQGQAHPKDRFADQDLMVALYPQTPQRLTNQLQHGHSRIEA